FAPGASLVMYFLPETSGEMYVARCVDRQPPEGSLRAGRPSLNRREKQNALDNFRGSDGAVATRYGEFLYVRWVHSSALGNRDRCGLDSNHPGTYSSVTSTSIHHLSCCWKKSHRRLSSREDCTQARGYVADSCGYITMTLMVASQKSLAF